MSIMELGALGEFIGSVAVVVSLIYLAVQVRQNMRMVRASVYQQYRDNLFDEREWESHKRNIRYWCGLGVFKKVIADESFLTTLEPEFVDEFRKTIAI